MGLLTDAKIDNFVFFFQQSAWYDEPLHFFDNGNFLIVLSVKLTFLCFFLFPRLLTTFMAVYCRAKINCSFLGDKGLKGHHT